VRGIGTAGLAASIVNVVVGSAIFTLPAVISLEAGAASAISYLVCAFIMAGVVICFAEAGSRVPTSGGAYGTVEAAFGPATGYVVGALLVVTSALASGGISAALAGMVGAVVPALSGTVPRDIIILGIYAVIVWANLTNVRRTAQIITLATVVKLVPLVLFALLGLLTLGHPPPSGPPSPPVTLGGFGRASILALFAFEGLETALMNSGEVRDPSRTVPRALFLSMLFVLALYLGVQLSAQHLLGGLLPHAEAPLADAAGTISPALRALMLAAAGLSMFVWLASDALGNSRLLFAFSRDRQLPLWFSHLSARHHVPSNAVLCYVAVCAGFALTGSFLELIMLSSLGTVVIYLLACPAALVLHQRNVAHAGKPLGFKALPAAAAVGVAGMIWLICAAQWSEIAATAAFIAASLALYVTMRRMRAGAG
jgi:amino acid transporter